MIFIENVVNALLNPYLMGTMQDLCVLRFLKDFVEGRVRDNFDVEV